MSAEHGHHRADDTSGEPPFTCIYSVGPMVNIASVEFYTAFHLLKTGLK